MAEQVINEIGLIETYRASRIAADIACALLIIASITLSAEWFARRKDGHAKT